MRINHNHQHLHINPRSVSYIHRPTTHTTPLRRQSENRTHTHTYLTYHLSAIYRDQAALVRCSRWFVWRTQTHTEKKSLAACLLTVVGEWNHLRQQPKKQQQLVNTTTTTTTTLQNMDNSSVRNGGESECLCFMFSYMLIINI